MLQVKTLPNGTKTEYFKCITTENCSGKYQRKFAAADGVIVEEGSKEHCDWCHANSVDIAQKRARESIISSASSSTRPMSTVAAYAGGMVNLRQGAVDDEEGEVLVAQAPTRQSLASAISRRRAKQYPEVPLTPDLVVIPDEWSYLLNDDGMPDPERPFYMGTLREIDPKTNDHCVIVIFGTPSFLGLLIDAMFGSPTYRSTYRST